MVYIPARSRDIFSLYDGKGFRNEIINWIERTTKELDRKSSLEVRQNELKIRGKFDKLHRIAEELKEYILEEITDISEKYDRLKQLTQEYFRENGKKYSALKTRIGGLEYNMAHGNKAVQTSSNFMHIIVFSLLGVLLGISIGILFLKSSHM